MSGFKDMVARDNFGVFLNCDEFAEKRTVKYDGATYEDIPMFSPRRTPPTSPTRTRSPSGRW